jgi:hypothetical protein
MENHAAGGAFPAIAAASDAVSVSRKTGRFLEIPQGICRIDEGGIKRR